MSIANVAWYYDPANSRFLTQDTYRGDERDPGSWHLYSYCANNPINYIDPSGHRQFSVSEGTKYAKKYATSRNSNYKSYGSDCTNFTSQIWNNGGVKMTNGWYYAHSSTKRASDTSTKSWRVAHNFVKYWGTYKVFEKKKSKFKRFTKNVKKGDIIASDKEGDKKWNHLGYVTDKGSLKTILGVKCYDLKIAQHSRDYHSWLNNAGTSGGKNGWVIQYSQYKNGKQKDSRRPIRYAILKRI